MEEISGGRRVGGDEGAAVGRAVQRGFMEKAVELRSERRNQLRADLGE